MRRALRTAARRPTAQGDGPTMRRRCGDSQRPNRCARANGMRSRHSSMRLATELGPKPPRVRSSTTSVGGSSTAPPTRWTATARKLRSTLARTVRCQHGFSPRAAATSSTSSRTYRSSSRALRDSKQQIVVFQNRLASLTSVVNSSRSDLDAALSDLSIAHRRGATLRRRQPRARPPSRSRALRAVTQNLVDNELDAGERVLQSHRTRSPTTHNIYYPHTGARDRGDSRCANFANPVYFVCGMIGGVAEHHRARDGETVRRSYLGPALQPAQPQQSAAADQLRTCGPRPRPQNIIYTDSEAGTRG